MVHYQEGTGSGPAVLFIHGSCGAGSQWKRLANNIGEKFHTFSIDLPGCGHNTPWSAKDKWNPAIDTAAIDALISRIDADVHLVLHSAGGHLAFQSLINNRDQLRTLTMFEPTYFNLLKSHDDRSFAQPDEMARTFQQHMDSDNIDAAMESFVDAWAKHTGTWKGFPKSVKDTMKNSAHRLYFEWDNIYGDTPTIEELSEFELPFLLVKGTNTIDSMHSVCSLIESAIPEISYVEVDGAGHLCPFTHTEIVTPVLIAHLEQTQG